MVENPGMVELKVEGMTCSNCAMTVQRKLEKSGMQSVNVNFATGEVRFENPAGKPVPGIVEGIEDLGYKVISADNPAEKKNS